MIRNNESIIKMKETIKGIVMNRVNITNYLDLYNYDINVYKTMDEYILDNYNYELFGKEVLWSELQTIGHKEIQHFIPSIIIISYSYNNYYEVIKWIQNEEYYKLMCLYALSSSYKIIETNIMAIKMTWFDNDKTGL
jgi:hypothetical protein